jgi:hypothetical protein
LAEHEVQNKGDSKDSSDSDDPDKEVISPVVSLQVNLTIFSILLFRRINPNDIPELLLMNRASESKSSRKFSNHKYNTSSIFRQEKSSVAEAGQPPENRLDNETIRRLLLQCPRTVKDLYQKVKPNCKVSLSSLKLMKCFPGNVKGGYLRSLGRNLPYSKSVATQTEYQRQRGDLLFAERLMWDSCKQWNYLRCSIKMLYSPKSIAVNLSLSFFRTSIHNTLILPKINIIKFNTS